MWELDCEEGWALKNWCLWTVVLERLLRVPWIERRSNQSFLKEINPEYSLEGLMKLKLQHFGHLMQRADSLERSWCWKRLKAGGEGDDRGWDGWLASLTQWTWVWANSRRWWRTGKPGVLQSMGSQWVGHDWAAEQQQGTRTRRLTENSLQNTWVLQGGSPPHPSPATVASCVSAPSTLCSHTLHAHEDPSPHQQWDFPAV